MDPSVWRRHRALLVLAELWPQLASEAPPTPETLAGWLRGSGSPMRVVSPDEAREGYETAVLGGAIPTRERSWHDTFNVLSFIAFPRAKPALHARTVILQRRRKEAGQPAGVRTREEDALALIDEGSLVFAGTAEAIAALDEARTRSLVEVDATIRSHGIMVHVLGHALLEHLVLGRAPIGAGVLTLALPEPHTLEAIDRHLAQRIDRGEFPTPCLSPNVPWPDPRVDAWIRAPREPLPPRWRQ